ncbi:PIN domain-containing protein [Sphingomonas natans]|uniref:VapC toxin family PIN domain ribonuclease n=1 Tax=Sphingomonas natans TaxID=3063330 RepID=UPI003D6650DE
MTRAVLDASAKIARLQGERGAGKVAGIVAEAAVGVFNQAEVVSHCVRFGAPIDEIRAMLGALPYSIVEADEAFAGTQEAPRRDSLCRTVTRRPFLPRLG